MSASLFKWSLIFVGTFIVIAIVSKKSSNDDQQSMNLQKVEHKLKTGSSDETFDSGQSETTIIYRAYFDNSTRLLHFLSYRQCSTNNQVLNSTLIKIINEINKSYSIKLKTIKSVHLVCLGL